MSWSHRFGYHSSLKDLVRLSISQQKVSSSVLQQRDLSWSIFDMAPSTRLLQLFLLGCLLLVTGRPPAVSGMAFPMWNVADFVDTGGNEKESMNTNITKPACKEGATRKGHCDLDCTCVSGKWQCCRLRKSVEDMPADELKRYIKVFKKAASDPRYKEVFGQIAYAHARFMCGHDLTAMPTMTTWHRMHVTVMENLFRQIDCRVTIPFWDYALHADKGWNQKIFSANVYGGNGSSTDSCVVDGAFRKGQYKPPGMHDGKYTVPDMACLKRNFDKTKAPLSWKIIQPMLTGGAENSLIIETGLQWFADSHMHSSLGGTFLNAGQGVDPVFYSMHNFVDKLIANWQLRGKDYLTGNGRWNITKQLVAFPWYKSMDWLDPQSLPGGVCLKWAGSQTFKAAQTMGYFGSLAVPRTKLLHLPYKELHYFKLSKMETIQYKLWLKYAKLVMGMTADKKGYHLPGTGQADTNINFKEFTSVNQGGAVACAKLLKTDPVLTKNNVSRGAQIL